MKKLHLEKYAHDVTLSTTEVWCEAGFAQGEVALVVDDVTCLACLVRLRDAGQRAEQRLLELVRML